MDKYVKPLLWLTVSFVFLLTGCGAQGETAGGPKSATSRTPVTLVSDTVTKIIPVEEHIVETDMAPFGDIEINMGFSDLEFVFGDHYQIDIYNYKSEIYDAPISFDVKGGKLYINQEENRIKQKVWNNVSYSSENNKVFLTIPKSAKFNILDIATSGDVLAMGLTMNQANISGSYSNIDLSGCIAGTVAVNTTIADLTLDNLQADQIQLQNTYGVVTLDNQKPVVYSELQFDLKVCDIKVHNVQAEQWYVQNTYGDVVLTNVHCATSDFDMSVCDILAENFTCQTSNLVNTYGAITGTNWHTKAFNANLSSCDLILSGSLEGKTAIENRYGDVSLNLNMPKDSYNIDLATSYGEIRVNEVDLQTSYKIENGNAAHSIYVQGNSCNVDLNFMQ